MRVKANGRQWLCAGMCSPAPHARLVDHRNGHSAYERALAAREALRSPQPWAERRPLLLTMIAAFPRPQVVLQP